MTILARYDALGHAIPFAADFEIESAALALLGDIPASADHDAEPDWDAAFDEPTDADRSWWAGESEADWRAEYEMWLDRLDTLAMLARMADDRGYVSDRDVMTVLGCAG
jgi:hypothetical protein